MKYNKEGDSNMLRTAHLEVLFSSDAEFPDINNIMDTIVEVVDIDIVTVD